MLEPNSLYGRQVARLADDTAYLLQKILTLIRNDRLPYYNPPPVSLQYYIRRYNHNRLKMRLIMAKKKVEKAKFAGFVNVHLTEPDKKQVAKLLGNETEAFELIEEIFMGGYDIKISKNAEYNNYNCSIMAWDTDVRNAGKIVSSFGSSWYQAIVVCAYKVKHILGDTDWQTGTVNTNEDFG